MARLNEAPAPQIDPAEILRRKYYRQNKEIARVNSAQGIRIRNLENEVSRLLAENLELREQILRQASTSQHVVDHISKIKSQFDAKLIELGALARQLEDEPDLPQKRSTRESKLPRASLAKSPDQKNWKNRCSIGDGLAGEDGKLPTIVENKSYPRRTLEPHEVESIRLDSVHDNNDSPEIGPPPVSQFINEDPIKIDLPTAPNTDVEDTSGLNPQLSINLEQRKKRKDSLIAPAQKSTTKPESSHSSDRADAAQFLKSGAKRKFSVRDEDEQEKSITTISPDEFKFTRRSGEDKKQGQSLPASSVAVKAVSKAPRDLAVARTKSREKLTPSLPSTTRKVLAAKTTNSPQKPIKAQVLDEIAKAKDSLPEKTTSKDRSRDLEKIPFKPLDVAVVEPVDIQPEPETPAPFDMFSPLSGPSGYRMESRDTPPPADLGPGNEGQRPSRRARGSISYAEPNLRDKMRRPTKELVDAVTGEGKAHKTSAVKVEDGQSTDTVIKPEPEADDAWKNVPSASTISLYSKSPLIDKFEALGPTPENLLPQRRRRSSMYQSVDDGHQRSGPSSALSALLARPTKVKQELSDEVDKPEEALDSKMAKLDIYEFDGTPPREMTESDIRRERIASRSSRRASALVQDLTTTTDPESTSTGTGSSRVSLITSRRRQSTLGLKIETEGQEVVDLASAEENNSRSDRMASRRRSSMML